MHLLPTTRRAALVPHVLLPLAVAAALGACGDGAAPAPANDAGSSGASAMSEAPSSDAPAAPAASAATAGRWSGEATGGYTGNRISFTVAGGGGSISDVMFEGHWDCTDGIESTTSGPSGTHPMEGGRIAVTSVDPPGGGATATRFVMQGQMEPGRASGTLRINLNALGCDTRELKWTAAPAGA